MSPMECNRSSDIALILGFFGINILDAAREQRLVSLPHTHLIGSNLYRGKGNFPVCSKFRRADARFV
jgi:hypothetical protein